MKKFLRKLFGRLVLLSILVFTVGYFAFDFGVTDWLALYYGDSKIIEDDFDDTAQFDDQVDIDVEDSTVEKDTYDMTDEEFEQYIAEQMVEWNANQKAKYTDVELEKAPGNRYWSIDNYARKCPESATNSVSALAAYLAAEADTDKKKARAIYVWLTDNVRYDDNGYNSGNYADGKAESVLKSGLAVCGGFANLYTALGKEMGLEIRTVSGFAKGYGFSQGKIPSNSNHAWNLIKINGAWRIYDATWGQGSGENVGGKMRSTKKFKDEWFDVDPYAAIFTHYPESTSDAMISGVFNRSTFYKIKFDDHSFFSSGFPPKKIYNACVKDNNFNIPKWWTPNTYIEMKEAPLVSVLYTDKAYNFEFFIPRAYELDFSVGSEVENVRPEKGIFKYTYTPKTKGDLLVHITYQKKDGNVDGATLLQYVVK